MINGTYKIVMKTLLGKKYGYFTLFENKSDLCGSIEIFGHRNKLYKGVFKNEKCRFSGEFVTPVRNIAFSAEGDMDEEKVNLLISTEKLTLPCSGEIEPVLS